MITSCGTDIYRQLMDAPCHRVKNDLNHTPLIEPLNFEQAINATAASKAARRRMPSIIWRSRLGPWQTCQYCQGGRLRQTCQAGFSRCSPHPGTPARLSPAQVNVLQVPLVLDADKIHVQMADLAVVSAELEGVALIGELQFAVALL